MPFGEVGVDHVSGARAGELRERPARRPRRRGDPGPRLPHRRRLRLLGRQLRAAARARPARRRGDHGARVRVGRRRRARCACARRSSRRKRLVAAVNADFGAVFDRSAERLYLIDERGREIPPDQALLLYLRLLASTGHRGKVVVPITATSQVEEMVGERLEVVRTPASLPELTRRRRRGRASSSRGAAAAATSSRASCPPTTRSRRSASCSSCSRPCSGRCRSSSPSCRGRRSSTARCSARGRSRARSCACSTSATRTANVDLTRRDQDLRRPRLGAGAARPRRAADPHLRRGRAEESAELEAELRTLVTDVIEREEIGARLSVQA